MSRRTVGTVVASLVVLAWMPFALAQPPGLMEVLQLPADAERGAELAAQQCASCHGADGHAVAQMYPHLAGQQETFLRTQLFVLRDGERPSDVMNPLAAQLEDQDIADLAAHFASQEPNAEAWGADDPDLVEQGARIFQTGSHEDGVIACAVCHGWAGQGTPAQEVPRIGGQAPGYVADMLHLFAGTPDVGSPLVSAMTITAGNMSDEQIEAVSAYLATMPWGAEPDGP